jgi:cytochrome c553
MRLRLGSNALAAALFWLACGPAAAQENPQAITKGDRARGEQLAYTCLGCHGIPNYRNAYPNYSVPKLSGQHPEYLVTALQAYKSGERSHATMHSQASSLSEEDMADVAAYFAGEPIEPDNKPEGHPPPAAQTCVACHGPEGIGITPQFPTLAGQHADYLARALLEYKRGGRKNPIMAPMAAPLTSEQIETLAEYYSRQTPALSTADVKVLSAER